VRKQSLEQQRSLAADAVPEAEEESGEDLRGDALCDALFENDAILSDAVSALVQGGSEKMCERAIEALFWKGGDEGDVKREDGKDGLNASGSRCCAMLM
jgi:hypothetical protein